MLKRKLCVGDLSSSKMLKINESSFDIETEDTLTDVTSAQNDRKFNFKLTDKKAKSNLIKSANRSKLEIEIKQQSLNLRFSAGAYLQVAKPFIKECENYFHSRTFFSVNDLEIMVNEFRAGKELNDKHFDTKIVFLVNKQKVTMHCYNSTQNIMVNGSIYQQFIEKFLEPFFENNVEKMKLKIDEYDKAVITTLNAKGRPLKARSVKTVRSAIQQVDFTCKKCGNIFPSHTQLMKHKAEHHTSSFNSSRSMIENFNKSNFLSDEKLLCDDITINDSSKKDTLAIEFGDEGQDSKTEPEQLYRFETVSCRKGEFQNQHIKELDVHMEQDHGKNHQHFEYTTEDEVCKEQAISTINKDVVAINNETNVEFCTKSNFKISNSTNSNLHMEKAHVIEIQNKPCLETQIEELTCRHCGFDAVSGDDLEKHLTSEHYQLNCNNCDFVTRNNEDLRKHISTTHINVSVLVHRMESQELNTIISCHICEYKCTLNRQMKTHVKRKHENKQECKYKCNFCNFESNMLTEMYGHKFEDHPDVDTDFRPQTKSKSTQEFILNLLAEQNIALMEEVLNLKNDIKDYSKLTEDVAKSVTKVEEVTTSGLSRIYSKIDHIAETSPSTSSPSSSTPPAPSTSGQQKAPAKAPPRPATTNRQKKSVFLSKPRLLYIGDSVAHNVDFAHAERSTNRRIRTVKAFSSVNDMKNKFPHKNITDAVPKALNDAPEDDEYTEMILTSPTADITNLDTSNLQPDDNTEVFKERVTVSCMNVFSAAENALRNHPKLANVLILEHPTRSDTKEDDPLRLKRELAKYANTVYRQLWFQSPLKNRVSIGSLSLNGKHSYTRSLIQAVRNNLPNMKPHNSPNQTSDDHTNCPQARYQKMLKTTLSNSTSPNMYNVPVFNKFSVLGNGMTVQ